MLGDERVKCWQAHVVAGVEASAGAVLSANADGIMVACSEGALRLEVLQRPGKRAVSAGEFAAQRELLGRQL
jgi:methionyl-tRNA formyltransferase